MTNPSPDTSAAGIVAWRFQWLRLDGTPTAGGEWHLAKELPTLLPSVANIEPLVLKSALDAANARAVALERDLRDALAVAEPWHKAYETQLARADALADLLDSNVSSLGKQLADEGRAREAAEAKLAKAAEALTALADSADSMGWSVNSGLADDAINNARRVLAEIEGKSK